MPDPIPPQEQPKPPVAKAPESMTLPEVREAVKAAVGELVPPPVPATSPAATDIVALDMEADAKGKPRVDSKLIPPPPGTDKTSWLDHSATKAALVSTVMNLFPLLRLLRVGDVTFLDALIDFGEKAAQDWFTAWLGITAAGASYRWK